MGVLLLVATVAIVGALALGSYGIAVIRGRARGITSPFVGGLFVGAAILVIAFGVGMFALAVSLGPHPW